MKLDGRRDEQANNPDDMDKYHNVGAEVIDTTSLSLNQTVKAVLNIVRKYTN